MKDDKTTIAGSEESPADALCACLLAVLLNPWFLAVSTVVLLLLVSLELAGLLDEAIWEYSAWVWAVYDAPPYVGSFENKPPGIFLLYRACFELYGLNLWPVRLLSVAAVVGTLFLVYSLARRYESRLAGGMAALVFGLSMGHHATDGYMLAVTETFMIFFTALAFYGLSSIYWRRPAPSHWSMMLGVGAAFGAALCFKQIALADLIGLIPMYWVATRQTASPGRIFRDVPLILVGVSAVTVMSLLPLIADGVMLRDYWYATWQILFYQSGALPAAERLKLIASAWTNPALTAYYPFVILYVFQKKRLQSAGVPFWSLLFWLGMAFVGANAGNVYRHQIKQVMLPLSLVAGIGIGGFVKSMPGFSSRWALCLYLAVVAALAPFNSALIGIAKQTLPAVMPCPGVEEERTNRRLADYIRLHTIPSDYVYIWAINSHPIHFYSERRSPCRYFNAIFQFAPDFESTSAAELAACPPKLILINDRGDKVRSVPACVAQLLAREYAPVGRIDGFQIFERSTAVNSFLLRKALRPPCHSERSEESPRFETLRFAQGDERRLSATETNSPAAESEPSSRPSTGPKAGDATRPAGQDRPSP